MSGLIYLPNRPPLCHRRQPLHSCPTLLKPEPVRSGLGLQCMDEAADNSGCFWTHWRLRSSGNGDNRVLHKCPLKPNQETTKLYNNVHRRPIEKRGRQNYRRKAVPLYACAKPSGRHSAGRWCVVSTVCYWTNFKAKNNKASYFSSSVLLLLCFYHVIVGTQLLVAAPLGAN